MTQTKKICSFLYWNCRIFIFQFNLNFQLKVNYKDGFQLSADASTYAEDKIYFSGRIALNFSNENLSSNTSNQSWITIIFPRSMHDTWDWIEHNKRFFVIIFFIFDMFLSSCRASCKICSELLSYTINTYTFLCYNVQKVR